MTARIWLRENGYGDVADLIDTVMARLAAAGSKERRNWWDVLAGGKDGNPMLVDGREFPVLRVAQIRQGKPTTQNAICRNAREQPPDVVATKRWPRKQGTPKASRSPRKASRRESSRARAS